MKKMLYIGLGGCLLTCTACVRLDERSSHKMALTSLQSGDYESHDLSVQGSPAFSILVDKDSRVRRKSSNAVSVGLIRNGCYLRREGFSPIDISTLFPLPNMESFTVRSVTANTVLFDFYYFEMLSDVSDNRCVPIRVELKFKPEQVTFGEIGSMASAIRETKDLDINDKIVEKYQRNLISYILSNGIPIEDPALWMAQENDCSATQWYCDLLACFIRRKIPIERTLNLQITPSRGAR